MFSDHSHRIFKLKNKPRDALKCIKRSVLKVHFSQTQSISNTINKRYIIQKSSSVSPFHHSSGRQQPFSHASSPDLLAKWRIASCDGHDSLLHKSLRHCFAKPFGHVLVNLLRPNRKTVNESMNKCIGTNVKVHKFSISQLQEQIERKEARIVHQAHMASGSQQMIELNMHHESSSIN